MYKLSNIKINNNQITLRYYNFFNRDLSRFNALSFKYDRVDDSYGKIVTSFSNALNPVFSNDLKRIRNDYNTINRYKKMSYHRPVKDNLSLLSECKLFIRSNR